ncbi:MAG: glycerol kinase [Chloroflexi bacterium RBG_16_68_14]|nr:MAG: glycerol kinase [Chloroflexi bacterium RBG_16_68_14]
MPRYILALDQGTSSSRAVLFDEEGAPIATEQREFPQMYPRAGWVEHDPEAIWSSQLAAAQDVLRKSQVALKQVAAVGITNQRETTVVWERDTGRPIANAVVWQCRRTAEQCDELRRQGLEPLIRERTGLVLDAYFSATKARWLLDHVPDAQRRAEAGELAFGTVDSWLIFRLTGGRVHATDASNASRTMLFNLREGRWDEELLRRFEIPASMLPQVLDSSGVLGECEPSLLGAALPIAGVAGDQQAALFGQACFRQGEAKNTYGTGSFLLLHTGETPRHSDRLLATVASRLAGRLQYALEGSIFVTGAAVQWLRDGLRFFKHAAEIEALAASVESSEGVYVVPAFVGLGAPHWDPYARGAILGITRGTTQAHIARATLKAIAFQTRDVLEAMEGETGIHLESLRADGGASRNDLLMQIQADLLGRPVVRSAVPETTALGAAYLAGLGIGLWSGLDDIARRWRSDRTFEPQLPAERREELYVGWCRAVERAKGWALEEQKQGSQSQ